MTKRIKYWLPVILWALLIFLLSSRALPEVTGTYWGDFTFKKLSHLVFYGILAVLIYRALVFEGMSKLKAIYFSVVFSMLYGISDEIHQSFVPGRQPHIRDIIFDTIGAGMSLLITKKILERFPKWEEKFL